LLKSYNHLDVEVFVCAEYLLHKSTSTVVHILTRLGGRPKPEEERGGRQRWAEEERKRERKRELEG
jgi:hypothetical protein